jgi:hypothetical protein
VFMAAGILVFVAAWIKSKEGEGAATSGGEIPSGRITQTASPSLTQVGPTINIHPSPVSAPPTETMPTGKEVKLTSLHNVSFQGARSFKFDFDLVREIGEDQEGIPGLKGCFLNQSIPGRSVSHLEYVRARVVYKDGSNKELTEISQVVWLGRPTAKHIHINVNRRECIALALWGRETGWVAPFTRWQGSEYGSQSELDCVALALGGLTIEITLVDGDNVGLAPVVAYVELKENGEIGFYRATIK